MKYIDMSHLTQKSRKILVEKISKYTRTEDNAGILYCNNCNTIVVSFTHLTNSTFKDGFHMEIIKNGCDMCGHDSQRMMWYNAEYGYIPNEYPAFILIATSYYRKDWLPSQWTLHKRSIEKIKNEQIRTK